MPSLFSRGTAALGKSSAAFGLAAFPAIVSLSQATISPDGSRIAFVVSRTDLAENRYEDALQVYDVRTGRISAFGGRHRSVSGVEWSPDSGMLAAVEDDPQTGVQQLYQIDGAGNERRLTSGADDVSDMAWDPSGEHIAFTRLDPKPPPATGAARFDDAFRVTDDAYLTVAPPRPLQLWLYDLRDDKDHRLTSGPLSVVDAPVSWSPDGRFIIFERGPAEYGIQDRADVERVDVRSGAITHATPHRSYEGTALYSPDGAHIAYLYGRHGDPTSEAEPSVENSDQSADSDIGVRLDRQVDTLAWMPDGRSLLEQVEDDAEVPLYIQPLRGTARRVPLGGVVAASIQVQGAVARDGTIVFIGDQSHHPDELFMLRAGAAAPVRLTSYNDGVAAMALGRVRRIAWRSSDGYEEDGVLTYPPGYVAGRKYPLVLRIHGGPYETSTVGFSAFYQLAASHGWLVFAPNYRGSNDRGNAYVRAIFDDPSVGPGRDILEGVAAVERLGIVDSSRIAVSGWSYGGQLTSWLEGHSHIWRAAVAGAAVNDLVVDYAIADDIDADRLMFRQWSPYHNGALALWRANSPITYFDRIRTPTLIMCNVYDVRVPVVESYEMFHALQDNGVPVELYVYPTRGHLPNGPVREMDADRRWMAWFERYLR